MRLCHPTTMHFERHINKLVIMASCKQCRVVMGRISKRTAKDIDFNSSTDWADFWTVNKMFREMMCEAVGKICRNCERTEGDCEAAKENEVLVND